MQNVQKDWQIAWKRAVRPARESGIISKARDGGPNLKTASVGFVLAKTNL
jgi:hypothetical protein